GGSLQALESQEFKCEVRVGYQGTKILKLVEEGYLVTEDDVKNGKVLVELDGSELQKQITQQEMAVQSAVAGLIDAQQNYEIQLGQNDTDIQAAEQKATFARMDFDKFLGDTLTAKIIEEVGLDKLLAAASTNNVEQTSRAEEAAPSVQPPTPAKDGARPPASGGVQPAVLRTTKDAGSQELGVPALTSSQPIVPKVLASNSVPLTPKPSDVSDIPEPDSPKSIAIDFSKYASLDALGDGEAKQKLRKFDDDLQVAQKELDQAKTTLEGTRRLFDKGFVTKTDLQRDEIAYENSRLKVVTAETAHDLFLKYDFLKSAQEFLSKFNEAVHEFDKSRRVAISKLAQAKAKLKSAIGQDQVQTRQAKDLGEQLEKCTLRAKKSGLVVYGGARDDQFYYGGEERIREGATVRERQAIITIPDLTRMSVNVKIHESYIKKVKKGQKARMTVDAFPDEILTGEVTKVGVLPDSQNRWMNPDLKVYLTTITIDGNHDWVKPGMSVKVEILVNKIENCIYVPVQAISPDSGKQVCFIPHGLKQERREVQVGEFNDEFIEVKSGIGEGERVLLRPPDGLEPRKPGKDQKEKTPEKNKKAQPSAPVIVPASAPATAKKA
ncbi:MAG: HlyD family secretion protein, partial [Verrucomicrobiota bacterium]